MALISSFMNRFRELGFIEYNGTLVVHSYLLNWSFMTGQEARGWIRQGGPWFAGPAFPE